MATQLLASRITVTNLAGGATTSLPHGLKSGGVGVTPTQVICDRASSIAVTAVDDLLVTFTNISDVMASANFRVEYDHSIHAVGTPTVAWQGWDGTAVPSGPAGGDLGESYPNPTVVGLNTRPLDLTAPITGDYLRFDGTVWRHTLVSPGEPTVIYGSWSDTTDQPIPQLPASIAVSYNTAELIDGVTLANNALGQPTRLTVPEDGVYSFDISPQLVHKGGTTTTVSFWAKINGVNVPRSASSVELGNNNSRVLPFLQLDLEMLAGQYLEWYFAQSNSAVTRLEHEPATAVMPANPSVIVTVKRIGKKFGT